MKRPQAGFSLIEVMIAAALCSVVAAGVLATFVATVRITHMHNASTASESSGYTSEVLEDFRTRVGADAAGAFFDTMAGQGWQDYALTSTAPTNSSDLSVTQQQVRRQYKVTKTDCDQDGASGDCYEVAVRSCWAGSTTCQ